MKLKYYECPECGGKGEQLIAKLYPSGHTETWEPCELCQGDGTFEEAEYLIMKLEGLV